MCIWDRDDEFLMAMHGAGRDGKPRTCQVCGGEPDALWMGADDMTVCGKCAIRIIPRLMADAVFASVGGRGVPEGLLRTHERMRSAWERAEVFYWRSAAHLTAARMGGPIRRTTDSAPELPPDDDDEPARLWPDERDENQ